MTIKHHHDPEFPFLVLAIDGTPIGRFGSEWYAERFLKANSNPQGWTIVDTTPRQHAPEEELIAHARSGNHLATRPGLILELADVLESTIAELQREREGAKGQRRHMARSLADAAGLRVMYQSSQADLARAREAIEKVREQAQALVDQLGPGDYYTGQEIAGESFLEILATYDKEGNDDD